MKKIAITGVESTGKTALTISLARDYACNYVNEHARFHLSTINNVCTEETVETIAKKQIKIWNNKWQKLQKTDNPYLFCDTDFINFKIWFEFNHWRVPDFIEENLRKPFFDFHLLLATDVAWEADGIRKNKDDRLILHQLFIENLEKYQLPYALVVGKGEERLINAKKALEAYFAK